MPLAQTIEHTLDSFSHSGRVLFTIFATLCVFSSISLLYFVNKAYLVVVPGKGGSVTEGIIGVPRFINPVLAISDSDRDLTALIYSGLLKAKIDGGYEPSLAHSYEVSEDGLEYRVTLRADATFSDGTPVTADDVLFTIEKARSPGLKSPLRASWNGILVEKSDQHTVVFTLKQPYAPFIKNLTLGILPKHLWAGMSDEEFAFNILNIKPVGSGPMRIKSITHNKSGIVSEYILEPFENHLPRPAHLKTFTIRFYPSELGLVEALNQEDIDAANGITPEHISLIHTPTIIHAPLSRVYGVFFNQTQSEALRDVKVRQALSESIDRKALVEQVLNGYGVAITGPLSSNLATETSSQEELIKKARASLLEYGWYLSPSGVLERKLSSKTSSSTETLRFTVSTGDVPELKKAAEYVRTVWQAVGADVTIQIFNQGDLAQNIIRPRSYEALLFGEVIGREPDLYAFWSSTERNNPGLNIALYTNAAVDDALKELRQTNNASQQKKLYEVVEGQLKKDVPVAFLYTPYFVYSTKNSILGLKLGSIENPSDRFLSITEWHRETDQVWPFFVRSETREMQ